MRRNIIKEFLRTGLFVLVVGLFFFILAYGFLSVVSIVDGLEWYKGLARGFAAFVAASVLLFVYNELDF